MVGWALPDVYDTFPLNGRMTKVGLYFRYIERHMRSEMQLVQDYAIALALELPDGLRQPAVKSAVWFSELSFKVQFTVWATFTMGILLGLFALLKRLCRRREHLKTE